VKGNIYFIEAVGADLVKIGFTTRWVSQRLREIQTCCPFELKLLTSLEDYPGREWTAHALFATQHVRGEWYRLDDRMRLFIEQVKTTGQL
jgi:hypothetical protein